MPCHSLILIPDQASLLELLDAEDQLIRHYTFHQVGKGQVNAQDICMRIYLTSSRIPDYLKLEAGLLFAMLKRAQGEAMKQSRFS